MLIGLQRVSREAFFVVFRQAIEGDKFEGSQRFKRAKAGNHKPSWASNAATGE
jgi:hypothetical protein